MLDARGCRYREPRAKRPASAPQAPRKRPASGAAKLTSVTSKVCTVRNADRIQNRWVRTRVSRYRVRLRYAVDNSSRHAGQRQSAKFRSSHFNVAGLSDTPSHQHPLEWQLNVPPHRPQTFCLGELDAFAGAASSYGQFRQPLSQHEPRAARNSFVIAPASSSIGNRSSPHGRHVSRAAACWVVLHFGQNRSVRCGIFK